MGLVFYDIETTGLNKFFDQILQFAAVRTDEDLKELEGFEIRCRILPNVVPAPEAMRITGMKASQLTSMSCPSHYEMVRSILDRIKKWTPAVFLGWNSIKFDEELLRQALYKTLHKPYITLTEGNTRSDVMRMVQACSVFAPDAIVIPTDSDGAQVFKLDQVAPANGFIDGKSHDALGDVRATIFLCRLIQERAPHIWSAFMRFSKKASVIDYIKEESVYCFSEFYFGRAYSYLVTTLGVNADNGSEYFVFDLNVDPEALATLTDSDLAIRIEQSPKPIRTLKCNAAPIIFAADDAQGNCRALQLGMDVVTRRAEYLKRNPALSKRLLDAFTQTKEDFPPSPHVEEQIYAGFCDRADEQLMEAFHKAEWQARPAIVEGFQDSRLRLIGQQLIYFERPELLSDALRREFDLSVAKRLMGQGSEIRWLTIPEALARLQSPAAGISAGEERELQAHVEYLHSIRNSALANLSA